MDMSEISDMSHRAENEGRICLQIRRKTRCISLSACDANYRSLGLQPLLQL